VIALIHLSDLRVWTWNARADPAWLEHLRTHLWELTAYLDANADALPNYGARYGVGQPISTGFAESAVNQILATRMIKRRQMRWNRDTVQPFLTVRVAVLNDALEQTFRSWHSGFRPVESHPCRTQRELSPQHCTLSATCRHCRRRCISRRPR
jgi:hypothetical protein